MIPKLNIKEKIEEHQLELVNKTKEILKLPITEVRELSFNPKSYEGSLSLKIGTSGAALLYKYENNEFHIDFNSSAGSLTNNWGKIYDAFRSDIEAAICRDYNTSADKIKITLGMKCEVYIEGVGEEKIRAKCEYLNEEWCVRRLSY